MIKFSEEVLWLPPQRYFDKAVELITAELETTDPELAKLTPKSSVGNLDANWDFFSNSQLQSILGAVEKILERVAAPEREDYPSRSTQAGFIASMATLKALLRLITNYELSEERKISLKVREGGHWEAPSMVGDFILESITGIPTLTNDTVKAVLDGRSNQSGQGDISSVKSDDFCILLAGCLDGVILRRKNALHVAFCDELHFKTEVYLEPLTKLMQDDPRAINFKDE